MQRLLPSGDQGSTAVCLGAAVCSSSCALQDRRCIQSPLALQAPSHWHTVQQPLHPACKATLAPRLLAAAAVAGCVCGRVAVAWLSLRAKAAAAVRRAQALGRMEVLLHLLHDGLRRCCAEHPLDNNIYATDAATHATVKRHLQHSGTMQPMRTSRDCMLVAAPCSCSEGKQPLAAQLGSSHAHV
jgi:hypothetical protein